MTILTWPTQFPQLGIGDMWVWKSSCIRAYIFFSLSSITLFTYPAAVWQKVCAQRGARTHDHETLNLRVAPATPGLLNIDQNISQETRSTAQPSLTRSARATTSRFSTCRTASATRAPSDPTPGGFSSDLYRGSLEHAKKRRVWGATVNCVYAEKSYWATSILREKEESLSSVFYGTS